MNQLANFASALWQGLNYPLINLGKSSITLWGILLNITLIVVFLLVSARVKTWLIAGLSKKQGLNVSNWRAAITLGYYALLVVGLVVILQNTGIDLSLFTVLTGAIGIGVGFGMQSIFSNFIGGVVLLLEKPLNLGDRIEVGEVSGNVQSISVRATTIVTNDNVSVIVPNSDFISKQLINWSHSGSSVRTSISIGVSYNSDPELVKKLLLEVAAQEPGVLKLPEPSVRLVEFGESSLNFSLLVWTDQYADRIGALKSLLNFSVLKAFRSENVIIPFPQREVRVLAEDSYRGKKL